MTGPPEVSVVVVSWNTRELLRRCLESMVDEADTGRIEVIVVDNASSDGSADLVHEAFPWAELLALEDNIGFGPAVNAGAARARGRWLAIANADIALRRGSLDDLLLAGERDPAAGALAPRLVLPDGTTQHSVFTFPTLGFVALLNLGVGAAIPALAERLLMVGAWDPERPRRVPWAIAAFLVVRRDAWESIGGFDERQWMYAEDLDLGWRLARAGYRTRYVPTAPVDHHSAASTSQAWGDNRTARWQRSTYAWMLRRRGWLPTRAVAAINVAGSGARWVLFGALARIAPARWAHRAAAARWWIALHREGLLPARTLEEHR